MKTFIFADHTASRNHFEIEAENPMEAVRLLVATHGVQPYSPVNIIDPKDVLEGLLANEAERDREDDAENAERDYDRAAGLLDEIDRCGLVVSSEVENAARKIVGKFESYPSCL